MNAPMLNMSGNIEMGWYPDLIFNTFNGYVQFMLQYDVPSPDKSTYYHLAFYLQVNTVSKLLLQTVKGPKQRLFLIIRSPAGTLIGTSHGKYFSHSDVDYITTIDPLTEVVPTYLFKKYDARNCSDVVISQAGFFLRDQFGGWDRIPELSGLTARINSEPYWVASQYLASQVLF